MLLLRMVIVKFWSESRKSMVAQVWLERRVNAIIARLFLPERALLHMIWQQNKAWVLSLPAFYQRKSQSMNESAMNRRSHPRKIIQQLFAGKLDHFWTFMKVFLKQRSICIRFLWHLSLKGSNINSRCGSWFAPRVAQLYPCSSDAVCHRQTWEKLSSNDRGFAFTFSF